MDTLELIRTLHYRDFVWRVFISGSGTPAPCVIAFISAEDRIQVNNLETGEFIHEFYGRLLFAGNVPIFKRPVVVAGLGIECKDISFTDVLSGETMCVIQGGFDRVFRAVVTSGTRARVVGTRESDEGKSKDEGKIKDQGMSDSTFTSPPMLVFTTWNSQNRQSTIQTYELTSVLTTGLATGCHDTNTKQDTPTKSSSGKLDAVRYPVDLGLMKQLFEGDSRDGVTSLVISKSEVPIIVSGHYDFIIRLWSIQSQEVGTLACLSRLFFVNNCCGALPFTLEHPLSSPPYTTL